MDCRINWPWMTGATIRSMCLYHQVSKVSRRFLHQRASAVNLPHFILWQLKCATKVLSLGGQTILINSCPRKFIFTERNFRVSEPQSEAHLLLSPILGYIWNLLAVLTICHRGHSTLSLPSSKCHSPSLRFMDPLNADPPQSHGNHHAYFNNYQPTLSKTDTCCPTTEASHPRKHSSDRHYSLPTP